MMLFIINLDWKVGHKKSDWRKSYNSVDTKKYNSIIINLCEIPFFRLIFLVCPKVNICKWENVSLCWSLETRLWIIFSSKLKMFQESKGHTAAMALGVNIIKINY